MDQRVQDGVSVGRNKFTEARIINLPACRQRVEVVALAGIV